MVEPSRVSPEEAKAKVTSGRALLVCAYDDDQKFKLLHLDGAISLNEFNSQLKNLHKDHEVIFYCA
jgi:hypothetical protein